jgi:hypothetical protein
MVDYKLPSEETSQQDIEPQQPEVTPVIVTDKPQPADPEALRLVEAEENVEPCSTPAQDQLSNKLMDEVVDGPHHHITTTSTLSLPIGEESQLVPTPTAVECRHMRVCGSPGITGSSTVGRDTALGMVEPACSEHNETKTEHNETKTRSPLQEELLSPRSKKFLDSVEIAAGSDPLSQLHDEGYFPYQTGQDSLHKAAPKVSSVTTAEKNTEKMVDTPEGLYQLIGADEAPFELSDNPLYGDDASDRTTDTDSSQQRSRRGSSAKLQSSSRGSSVASPPSSLATTFAAKHVKSKGAPSLGVSHAVSDLSWESSLQPHVPRQRSGHIFAHSVSPFEGSTCNSPADLSSSFQSLGISLQQQHEQRKAASLSPPSASLPAPSNLLPFQEGRRLGEESGSDFSGDENDGPVEQEHFSLCAAAVDDGHSEPQVTAVSSPSPLPPISKMGVESFYDEEVEQPSIELPPDPEADIWVTVPHPCRGHIQNICLSDRLLWLVDSRSMVYCTDVNTKGKKWELIKHPMQQVSSSPSGCIVWGVHHQNAYVRLGLELNVAGQYGRM